MADNGTEGRAQRAIDRCNESAAKWERSLAAAERAGEAYYTARERSRAAVRAANETTRLQRRMERWAA